MLKTCEYHSFIQRPHFSQIAKNLFWAIFFTPADIAAYSIPNLQSKSLTSSAKLGPRSLDDGEEGRVAMGIASISSLFFDNAEVASEQKKAKKQWVSRFDMIWNSVNYKFRRR